MLELNKAYNMDCMAGMARFPDKYFDLAVVDPPYGSAGKNFKRQDGGRFGGWFDKFDTSRFDVNFGGYRIERTGGTWAAKYGKKIAAWDHAPGDEYFAELFRVSKEQIIWGGNYFALPPCRCFLVWHKTNIPEKFTMAMAEYAWCSMNTNAKVFRHTSHRDKQEVHFHPTEKPIALYEWIYRLFAKPGMKILDTHLGSGNSRKAALNAGLDFVGFELDPDYFRLGEAAFEAYKARQNNACRMPGGMIAEQTDFWKGAKVE